MSAASSQSSAGTAGWVGSPRRFLAPLALAQVSDLVSGNGTYVAAMIVLAVMAVVGFAVALFLPGGPRPVPEVDVPAPAAATRGA